MTKNKTNSHDYDERQLFERNNAFKFGFIVVIGMLLIGQILNWIFGEGLGNTLSFWVSFWCGATFWVSISTVIIFMILKDAYDGINSRPGMIIFSMWGIAAFLLGIANAMVFLIKKPTFQALLEDGITFSNIVMYACWLSMCGVYWIKYLVDKKKNRE